MWTVISVVAAILFALFAWFQLNDPDPAIWVTTYALTAAISLAAGIWRLRPGLFVLWAAACVVRGVALWVSWDGSSSPMGDPSQGIFAEEVVREAGGLAICAGWMLVAAAQSWWVKGRERADEAAPADPDHRPPPPTDR